MATVKFVSTDNKLDIQLDDAHFSVAGNLDPVRAAWPHLNEEVRSIVTMFDKAGLRPSAISVTDGAVDGDDATE